MSRKNTRFVNRFGRVGEGGGILIVDSWADRPPNPESGDLFMIRGSRQIYRSPSGGSWTEGWHPSVDTVGNASGGNVEGETLYVSGEGAYHWDNTNNEWINPQNLIIVDSWADRPSNPDAGLLMMISGTRQIYRTPSGGSWTEGWHPEVSTIANANPGNIQDELVNTADEGAHYWDTGRSEWVRAGIELVDSYADRPTSSSSGDLIMIRGTSQIYRSDGADYNSGWHPDVSTIANANPGNIQDEVVATDDEDLYYWDTGRSEWVRSGIELVNSYSNRPASPDTGDLIMIRSTGQIYRSDGTDYNEGWHPDVITIEDANNGNVDGEVIHTDDSGAYEWNSSTLSWEQPLGDQSFKTLGYPVTVETIVGITPDGPTLRDTSERNEKLDYGAPRDRALITHQSPEPPKLRDDTEEAGKLNYGGPRDNSLEVTRVDDPPELRRSVINNPAFNLSTSRGLAINADPYPLLRTVGEVGTYKPDIDSSYSMSVANSNWTLRNNFTSAHLRGVEVISASDVWICGDSDGSNNSVWHYDGSTWTGYSTTTNERLLALDYVSAMHVWAGGDNGVIIFWDGSSWATQTTPDTTAIKCMSMISSTDGWVGGFGGVTWQWNGTNWNNVSNSISETLWGAAFESDTSGWFVGDNGAAYQWNGTSFTSMSTPVSSSLRDVNFGSAGDAWACGDNGVILEWDGSNWTQNLATSSADLWGIYMVDDTTGWAVGDNGTILRWDGLSWTQESVPTTDLLYDTFFISESLTEWVGWAVGTNGTHLSRE